QDTARERTKTRPSIETWCGSGTPGGTSASSTSLPQHANPHPSTPPQRESKRLSVSIWRNRRQRVAPSALRTAISFWRAAARERSSVATFAQAIKSTKATAAVRTRSSVWTDPTTLQLAGSKRQWNPGIRAAAVVLRPPQGELKIRRHDTDDGIRPPVEADRPAKHTPVLTIAACPKAITEQDQVMPRCVLLAGKVSSQNRLNAEHRKERGRDARDCEPFWFTLAGNLAPFVTKCPECLKRFLVAFKNVKVRRGKAHFRKAQLRN